MFVTGSRSIFQLLSAGEYVPVARQQHHGGVGAAADYAPGGAWRRCVRFLAFLSEKATAFPWLGATVVLGGGFLTGQWMAWRELADRGFYLATSPSSSFVYLLTATHAVHLAGGILVLLYAAGGFSAAPAGRGATHRGRRYGLVLAFHVFVVALHLRAVVVCPVVVRRGRWRLRHTNT